MFHRTHVFSDVSFSRAQQLAVAGFVVTNDVERLVSEGLSENHVRFTCFEQSNNIAAHRALLRAIPRFAREKKADELYQVCARLDGLRNLLEAR